MNHKKRAVTNLAAGAILVACAGAHAMDAMNDDALADSTGQSGITIYTDLSISGATLTYQDTDGLGTASSTTASLTAAGYLAYAPTYLNSSGATVSGTGQGGDINIRGLGFFSSTIQAGAAYTTSAANAAPITTTIDAGASAGGAGVVQVGISIPQLNVTFSGVDVCQATVSASAGPCSSGSASAIITAPTAQLVIQNLSLNLQLGSSPQGHLGLLSNGSTPFSLALGTPGGTNNIILDDPNNANGGIGVGYVLISGLDFGTGADAAHSTYIDACSSTITTNCGATVSPGLLISFGSSTMNGGAGGGGISVVMQNLTMGDTSAGSPSPAIGNLAFYDLNLGGTSIRIVGH